MGDVLIPQRVSAAIAEEVLLPAYSKAITELNARSEACESALLDDSHCVCELVQLGSSASSMQWRMRRLRSVSKRRATRSPS